MVPRLETVLVTFLLKIPQEASFLAAPVLTCSMQDLRGMSVQFSSVQSLSRVQLFVTPWTATHQASLSITNSRSLHKLMSIESVMPSNHLILCRPLLLPPSIFPSIRVFSNDLFISAGKLSWGMWDLVPWPGRALGAWSLSHWTSKEVPPLALHSNAYLLREAFPNHLYSYV